MYCDQAMIAIDKGMAFGEAVFNILGYIPGISSVTGPVRATAGKIEIIASFFIGLYVLFQSGNVDEAKETIIKYVMHGAANIGRGIVEFIPLFGNLCTFLWDHPDEGLPSNRIKYEFEDLRTGQRAHV